MGERCLRPRFVELAYEAIVDQDKAGAKGQVFQDLANPLQFIGVVQWLKSAPVFVLLLLIETLRL